MALATALVALFLSWACFDKAQAWLETHCILQTLLHDWILYVYSC